MSKAFQPQLLPTPLPPGAWHLQGFLTRAEQEAIRDKLRAVARAAPLFTPRMRGGTPFKLQLTNCGRYGWMADENGYAYVERHPETGRPWPQIPALVLDVTMRAAREAGFPSFAPQSCLVNFYRGEQAGLGMHQDKTERDLNSPIVTISLGETAIFALGGIFYSDKVTEIALESGDVFILGSVGRLYFHGIKRILAGSSNLLPQGGRISATLRRVR